MRFSPGKTVGSQQCCFEPGRGLYLDYASIRMSKPRSSLRISSSLSASHAHYHIEFALSGYSRDPALSIYEMPMNDE